MGPKVFKEEPDRDRVEDLVVRQTTELDDSKRMEILKQIQQELLNSPGIPLYTLHMIYAINKRIEYTMPDFVEIPANFWTIKVVQ